MPSLFVGHSRSKALSEDAFVHCIADFVKLHSWEKLSQLKG
jgi:hypothetical protein